MSEIDPKLSRLYRDASAEQPPAALDAAILAAARKHVAKPPRRERSSWWRWMAPASAAATLALGVSIALLIEREQPARLDETAPRAAPAAEAAKAADSAVPAQVMTREAPAADLPAPMRAAPAPVTSAPLPAQLPAPAAAAPAPAAARAEPAPRQDAPAAQAFPLERRERAAESKLSAPQTAAEANAARDAAAGAPGASAAGAPAAAGRLAPLRQQAVQRAPEAWLDEIERLKREGRDQEVAEQLAEFRKAHPAYALPDRLLLTK